MKRHLALALVLTIVLTAAAQAQSWVFNQSYYSHDPVSRVRIGRQYSTGPVFTRPQGAWVTSGWRYNRSAIQVGGQVYDQMNVWENWYQLGEQF